MKDTSAGAGILMFGNFQADLRSGELRKDGRRIRLQQQPFQILAILLERPGEVVTREELHTTLWPGDTFVDFEHGLNNAVNRLREALCDSADTPRYIETLPRRGYRFIAPVESADRVAPPPASIGEEASRVVSGEAPVRAKGIGIAVKFLLGGAMAVAVGALLWSYRSGHAGWRLAQGPRIQSLAVLPLENLSGDPSQDYFADGMTDALITDLAQIGSLRIISRTSSVQYKHTRKPLRQIARELNVDAVVEGTVVRSGNRVRIDAQLIRADTDQHLWARSYEGELSQILALQSAVAEAVSSEVRAKLTPQERAQLTNQRPVNPEAYELYLRGSYFLETRTQDGMKKALQYFQEATEKDPSSALAFAGLSDAFNLLGAFGYLPEKETIPKARAAAEKAVGLDSSSAEALTSLAVVVDDPAQAEKLFARALQSNPGYALAHHWYARFLSENQRYGEALVEIRRARSLDPLSVRIVVNEGEILFFGGQFEKAREQLQHALDLDSNFPITHFALGRSLFYARQYDAALRHLRRATELNANDPAFHRWLAVVYEFLGRYREAIPEFEKIALLNGSSPAEVSARAQALRNALSRSGEPGYWREWIALRLKDREKSPHLFAYNIAYDYAHLGDKARAVAWLETCFQEKSCNPALVPADPSLDGLRSDTSFQSLLARMSSSR